MTPLSGRRDAARKLTKSLLVSAMAVLAMMSLAQAADLPNANLVDPPVVLTNATDQALIIKWQTSIPGVAAAPVEHRVVEAGTREEQIAHANFWVTEPEPEGDVRGVTNMIEVWVYDQDAPDLLVSRLVTYRNLYAADFAQLDKTVTLEIAVSATAGIDVTLVQAP